MPSPSGASGSGHRLERVRACSSDAALLFAPSSRTLGRSDFVPKPPINGFAPAEVVRVQASGCAGSERTRVGTGFAWHSTTEIVTSLHVVAGCKTATAYSERDQLTYPLSITHALKGADLALLAVGDNAAFPVLIERLVPAQLTDVWMAWGYGEATPSMRSYRMHVAGGGASLRDNVGIDVANAIARAGSPALDVNVVPIDDPTAPGLSGAPLLDAQGRIRAVADGGVAHGITHVSWAIPAIYLQELLRSTEPTDVYIVLTPSASAAEETRAEVFRADFPRESAPTITCGTSTLRFSWARSFADAAPGTDSPAGLNQLLSIFGGVPTGFALDVYEDAKSGATVASPAGAKVISRPDYCSASLVGGQIEMRIQVTPATTSQAQTVSTQFESSVGPPPVQAWISDAAWSYAYPFSRPDGLIVRRRAFARSYPQNAYGLPTDYLFETLAHRKSTFLGVMAIRSNDLAFGMCMRGIPGAVCPSPEYMRVWAEAALAVHLASFSVSASNPNSTPWQQLSKPGG